MQLLVPAVLEAMAELDLTGNLLALSMLAVVVVQTTDRLLHKEVLEEAVLAVTGIMVRQQQLLVLPIRVVVVVAVEKVKPLVVEVLVLLLFDMLVRQLLLVEQLLQLAGTLITRLPHLAHLLTKQYGTFCKSRKWNSDASHCY
jgi:hypothetical protein